MRELLLTVRKKKSKPKIPNTDAEIKSEDLFRDTAGSKAVCLPEEAGCPLRVQDRFLSAIECFLMRQFKVVLPRRRNDSLVRFAELPESEMTLHRASPSPRAPWPSYGALPRNRA